MVSLSARTSPARSSKAGPSAKPLASAVAPYARVKQALKAELAGGAWPAGSLMPSEAELVLRFGVSRMTVNRALRELQGEGLVERTQGVGTFAARLHRVASTLKLQDVHEEIVARGHRHRAVVHVQRREPANAAVATRLGLRAGDEVFHTLIVHHENDVPLQCEDRYVNPACVPDFLAHDFTRTTPTHVLFERTALWRAEYAIEAGCATAREARLLGIAAQDPCLIITRRTHTRDTPITAARLVHPGTRYLLQGDFQP